MKKLKFFFGVLTNEPYSRFKLLHLIGKIVFPKYRFKWPQMEWWDNLAFNEYLVRFGEINGMDMDRRWMVYQLMRLIENTPGDTAECGVYKGSSSYLICKLSQKNKLFERTHFMFDSFEGLSKPDRLDGKYWTERDLNSTLEIAKENLAEFKNISFHKGWIPERFSDVENRSFCFVHIDVDLYQPTLDSIKFFYPLINDGGIIICDDYGFTTCPGATKAIDEFLQDKKEKMISMSGGGGFFIKGVATSAPAQL